MGWEENIRKVVPYVAGEQPKGKTIKLNTNEFPYAPSPMVATRMYDLAEQEIADSSSMLRKYPDMDSTKLVDAISKVYDIPTDNIFVGIGSDDVLSMAFMTCFNSEKPIFFPDITYSFYDVWANVHKIPFTVKPLDDNFAIVKEDYLTENGGIVIPNPNAPTGVYVEPDFFEDIVKANPNSVVIIDEAYVDFGGTSCLPLVDKYDNVLIVQTFSKSRALAGLRIGVAFGQKKLIDYIKDIKFSVNSYTLNYPAIELATASVLDVDYWKKTVKKVIKTREWTAKKLKELGFIFNDSKANFIFATHPEKSAVEIFEELKDRSIYVRYWNKPRISNYLRISIGTDDDMKNLVNALEEILK